MKSFEHFTQVVHKALGSEPMVVIPTDSLSGAQEGQVTIRRAITSQHYGTTFTSELFWADELETPMESIEREGEIFKTLAAKRKEISADEPQRGPVGIGHLN